ncbi:MAG: hypothetical protein HN842_09345, partial [Gammaproteobacteria bacterium]|nr:hypothetical protein [Gammaproteobacteria bacterium]
MKIKKHLQHLSQWSSKRTPLRYILVRQQHHFYIRSIRRRLKSLKRRHSRLIPFLIPILTTTLILLSTFFLLTALNSTPHAPGLKNGSGNTLFTAGNKTFSADIGTRDGSPQVAFQVESAVATFTLAGIDQSEGEKVGRDTVLFQDVLPSIDLQYTTLSNGVKEELIIKEPRTNNQELTTTFLFDLSLSGTTPKELTKRPDGVISLSPTFQDSNGEYLFHFEKPYAYDANGARTDNVLMQIGEDRSVPGKYYLKLTVDPTWLNDPARVYPVVIDPTVVHDTTTEFSAGTLDRVKDTGTG